MADNATIREAHRRAADVGRRAAESAGARGTTVTIRVREYSAPVGTSGASVSSTTDVVLDPRPKVSKTREGRSSYFGGSILGDSNGRMVAGEYDVGPITQDFSEGGYTPADLAPTGSATRRVTVVLGGEEFRGGAEEFEIVAMDATRPHQIRLQVGRVRQGA